MKQLLQEALSRLLPELGFPISAPVILETPTHSDFGHYALTVAFSLAKTLRMPPKVIGENIANALSTQPDWQGTITFSAVNGYVNIKLNDKFLWEYVGQLSGEGLKTYSQPDSRPLLLEYVSANPTGPLHIGHGRWAVLGDVMARLLKVTGYQVSTEFYINDAGSQIQKLRDSVAAVREKRPIPEDGYHGAYIHDLAASANDPVDENLAHQQAVLKKMGVEFDVWFSEKSLHQPAFINDVLDRLKAKNFTETKEGALWFKSSLFGDDKDRVLIKSDGAHTYFLMDLVYHFNKINRGFSRLINIWGADHHGYIQRVKAGVAALCGDEYKNEESFKVMIGQLVSLYRNGEQVRMSKRTGDMITLEEVVDEIGSDAVRYFLAEKSPDTHVEFDLGLAVKQSAENPVYYCQYAHARLCSMLEKVGAVHGDMHGVQLNDSERQLLSHLLLFPDDIWEAAKHLSPYRTVQYTYELARRIQSFYEHSPVLKAEESLQKQRVILALKAKEILAFLLSVLGVSAPEKM
jgi:arginyl-tRNA synthetase